MDPLSSPTAWGVFPSGDTAQIMTPPSRVLEAAFADPVCPTEVAYIMVVGRDARQRPSPQYHLVVDDEVDPPLNNNTMKDEREPATTISSNPTIAAREQPPLMTVPDQIQVPQEEVSSQPEMSVLSDDFAMDYSQATSILARLAESEKRERKLQRQLVKSGISTKAATSDISYGFAKQKISEIAERMNSLSFEDAADAQEIFQLEKEMEHYTAAMMLTDEYQDEIDRAEVEWEESNAIENEKALQQVRCNMPVAIRRKTVDEIKQDHPDLPLERIRRFKRTNVLPLIRVDPAKIEAFHPSMLESLRVTGLTLTERRALHSHLVRVGENWKEKAMNDTVVKRKFEWYTMMKTNFRESLDAYQRHQKQYPPNESDGSCPCSMKGRGCPIRANAMVDYNQDYGCPASALYEEEATVVKRTEAPPSTVSAASSTPAPEVTPKQTLQPNNPPSQVPKQESPATPDRRLCLKKHYRGSLLHVSRANLMCESVEEHIEEFKTTIRPLCSNGDTTDTQRAAKDIASYSKSLQRLVTSLRDRQMEIRGSKYGKLSQPEIDLMSQFVNLLGQGKNDILGILPQHQSRVFVNAVDAIQSLHVDSTDGGDQ